MTYAADFVELMKKGDFKFGASFDGDGVSFGACIVSVHSLLLLLLICMHSCMLLDQWRGGSTLAGGHSQFWRPLENCDCCLLYTVPWLFQKLFIL